MARWIFQCRIHEGWTYGRCNDPDCELRFRVQHELFSLFLLYVSGVVQVGDGTTIAGLDEGIRGMREGGYRRFLIPPQIAYQEGGFGKPCPAVPGALWSACGVHLAGQELQPLPERDDMKRTWAPNLGSG